MTRELTDFLPAPPPFVPLPRFLIEGEAEEGGNPLAPEELRALEGKYGSWAARLADAFATDFESAQRVAKGLSERIIRRF